ncbi:MAG: hypothetical protein U5R31_17760 [Acidimicrobiia bacterium]|nr:hypothetical protein [Acidimicrobiia bacterium]
MATADDGTEVGPLEARNLDNGYAVFIPDDGKTRWEVEVRISGPPGETETSHAMHGLAVGDDGGGGGPPWWLIGATAALGLGIALLGLRYVWLRRATRHPGGHAEHP